MFALDRLMESLSIQEETNTRATSYQRALTLAQNIEEAVWTLLDDPVQGRHRLEDMVCPVVSEVRRIDGHLASVAPSAPAELAHSNALLRRGLECYHAGMLELAQCLEDLDLARVTEARRLVTEGHQTLQAARECLEDSWQSEAWAV